jgi:hypothetical protein
MVLGKSGVVVGMIVAVFICALIAVFIHMGFELNNCAGRGVLNALCPLKSGYRR